MWFHLPDGHNFDTCCHGNLTFHYYGISYVGNILSVLEVHLPKGGIGGTIIEYLWHKSVLNGDV